MREMILEALQNAGGVGYLTHMAQIEPVAFLTLLGKTLPKDVKLGGGLRIEVNLLGPVRRDA